MTIRERLQQLKKKLKTDRYIAIYDETVGYSPLNTGLYLDGIDDYINDVDNTLLDRELAGESNYTYNGVKCIGLAFRPAKGAEAWTTTNQR